MCQMMELRDLVEPNPFTPAEQRAIDDLKMLCNQYPHIHFQKDNYFLTKFLRFCDWNAQKACEAILHFYTLKVRICNFLELKRCYSNYFTIIPA